MSWQHVASIFSAGYTTKNIHEQRNSIVRRWKLKHSQVLQRLWNKTALVVLSRSPEYTRPYLRQSFVVTLWVEPISTPESIQFLTRIHASYKTQCKSKYHVVGVSYDSKDIIWTRLVEVYLTMLHMNSCRLSLQV